MVDPRPHELNETAFEISSIDPALARDLLRRLFNRGSLRKDIHDEIPRMESEHGRSVYAELIHLFSHLRFEPEEAKRHWMAILEHRRTLEERLGAPVELRVALLRYFTEVDKKLVNPKIIEIGVFERARTSAYTDDLTGLWNYRYFAEAVEREVLRSEQTGAPVSLVMCDVDAFKLYNDHNGHEAGNHALASVAHALKTSGRVVDVVSRYGGEEFVTILPATPKEGARLAAERMRSSVGRHDFANVSEQPGGRLTISLGVATYPADADDPAGLVRSADHALYEAKSRGRNQVRMYAGSARSFPRASVDIDGMGLVPGSEEVPLRVLQIGEGGTLFEIARPLEEGTLIDTWFRLPGTERVIRASGRIVRVTRTEGGRFHAAFRFVELGTADRFSVGRFVKGREVPSP